jgi:hypothetical protein
MILKPHPMKPMQFLCAKCEVPPNWYRRGRLVVMGCPCGSIALDYDRLPVIPQTSCRISRKVSTNGDLCSPSGLRCSQGQSACRRTTRQSRLLWNNVQSACCANDHFRAGKGDFLLPCEVLLHKFVAVKVKVINATADVEKVCL